MFRNLRRFSSINTNTLDYARKENIIQVNTSNKVVGPISKYDAHLISNIRKGIYHRAFSLFVIDKEMNLLLQQRSSKKVLFPLLWSNTVCSHPLYEQEELEEAEFLGVRKAARRRLLYELNIVHENLEDYKCLDSYLYQADGNEIFGESECEIIR